MIQLRRERGESLHDAVWRAKTTVAKRLHSKVGTIERAREIRRMVADGQSIVSVGRELGLHRATVFCVVHDMTWRESAPSPLALIAQQAGMMPSRNRRTA